MRWGRVPCIVVFTAYLCVQCAHADTCATGFNESNAGVLSAYTVPGNACHPGDTLVPIKNAYVITNITKCAPTGYLSNGVCVPYARTACATGFNDTNVGAQSLDPQKGSCGGALSVPLKNAYIIESLSARCAPGYYPTSNGCVAYGTGDGCPTNSYTPNQSFTRPGANDACATNYGRIDDIELCKSWVAGMPYICTPQLPCTSSIATTLRTSTGIILPLYAEKATAPSLHILFPNNDLCYGNFIPGAANNAINVRFHNEIYHGVE